MNPFALIAEMIRTPFDPQNIPRYNNLHSQDFKYYFPLLTLIFEAKQVSYASLKNRRFELLTPELQSYSPLIGLSSFAAGKTTAEEAIGIYPALLQLLLKDGEHLNIRDILSAPMCLSKRFESSLWLLGQLGVYRDFHRLSDKDHQTGLKRLAELWSQYPILWQAAHQKQWGLDPPKPFQLSIYDLCSLQLFRQKRLTQEALQPFLSFCLAYAQQYPSQKCPSGKDKDGRWSQKLLALREIATVYLMGLQL